MNTQAEPQGQPSIESIVTCDEEAWLKNVISTAILCGIKIDILSPERSNEGIRNCAIEGVVNGAAVEVIRIFGKNPAFENLRRIPFIQR